MERKAVTLKKFIIHDETMKGVIVDSGLKIGNALTNNLANWV